MIGQQYNYLLDTNVYLEFCERSYFFHIFPGFWSQFQPHFQSQVKIPDVVINEIHHAPAMAQWIQNNYFGSYIQSRAYFREWGEVMQAVRNNPCYSPNALKRVKGWADQNIADAWLLAIARKEGYVVVSNEKSNHNLNPNFPSSSPKIPDVARDLDVRCINMRQFFDEIQLVV